MAHQLDESRTLTPFAIKRTWIFMLVALVLYGWALDKSIGGVAGFPRLMHLLGVDAAKAAPPDGWIAALIVAVTFIVFSMRSYPLIRERVFDFSTMKAVAIVFAFASGILEELWFRRAPMDWAQARGWGIVAQILLSAVLFGAVHGVWGIFARNVRVALGSTVATGLLGAALAIVYLLSDRVLAPCIWAHAGINLVIEPWLLLAAMSRGAPAIIAAHEAAV
jgi:hypothetical protein